jgi:hypothetical protein
MRWHRDARLLNVMLVVIGLIGHLVMMWGVLPSSCRIVTTR